MSGHRLSNGTRFGAGVFWWKWDMRANTVNFPLKLLQSGGPVKLLTAQFPLLKLQSFPLNLLDTFWMFRVLLNCEIALDFDVRFRGSPYTCYSCFGHDSSPFRRAARRSVVARHIKAAPILEHLSTYRTHTKGIILRLSRVVIGMIAAITANQTAS